MRENLNKYHLSEEERNMIKVFMLLYGYNSVDELLDNTENDLEKHKGWNSEMKVCIDKMKGQTN